MIIYICLILLSACLGSGITGYIILKKQKQELKWLFKGIEKLEDTYYPFIRSDLNKALEDWHD